MAEGSSPLSLHPSSITMEPNQKEKVGIHMDRRQIEIILAVAELLSFSEAAWATSFSASTVSKQVSAAEAELGIKLFERKARSKVSLTAEGESALPYLRRIADDYSRLETHIASVIRDNANQLSIACPTGFSTLGEDQLIALFCRAHPEVTVNQVFGSGDVCQNMLQHGRVDAAFRLMLPYDLEKETAEGRATPGKEKHLQHLPLFTNHLLVAIKNNHPAIKDGRVDLAQLKEERFLFRKFNDHMDSDGKIFCFKEACQSEGFDPQLQFLPNMRNSTVFNMVAEGVGVAPLMYLPNIMFQGVSFLPLQRDYYHFVTALSYPDRNQSTALRKFLKCIKSQIEEGNFTDCLSEL